MNDNERKLLYAAKFALGSIQKNKIHLPITEGFLKQAIRNYGEEHFSEVIADVTESISEMERAQLLVDMLFKQPEEVEEEIA
jgi:hypothetical protein